jgi:NOL1/NOP2/fmu family ribosome biogenesis protein
MIVYHYNIKVKIERPQTQTNNLSGSVIYRTITENVKGFLNKVSVSDNPIMLGNFKTESFRFVTEYGMIQEKDKLTIEHTKEEARNYDGIYIVKSAFYYPSHSEYELERIS